MTTANLKTEPLAPRTLFLLGISQRSGTNYLLRLLLKNPILQFALPSGEDFLIYYLKTLLAYRNEVTGKWTKMWQGFDPEAMGHRLDEQLRNALYQFLWADQNPDYLITKTPFFQGLTEAGKFLPESKYILLLRDGRNVVESMVQGFSVKYEEAMQMWATNAKSYIDFGEQQSEVNYTVVRYEELANDSAETVRSIFSGLNISDTHCDYPHMKEMAVVGSSYSDAKQGKVNWQSRLKRDEIGDVNARFADWNRATKRKYNRICGRWAEQLGYESF